MEKFKLGEKSSHDLFTLNHRLDRTIYITYMSVKEENSRYFRPNLRSPLEASSSEVYKEIRRLLTIRRHTFLWDILVSQRWRIDQWKNVFERFSLHKIPASLKRQSKNRMYGRPKTSLYVVSKEKTREIANGEKKGLNFRGNRSKHLPLDRRYTRVRKTMARLRAHTRYFS